MNLILKKIQPKRGQKKGHRGRKSKKRSTRQRLLNDSISAGEQGSGMGQL